MAGAGFKTFNTGDVLTASDVNTYLMQQTVMVFDDASARSTALPTPSEGMFSYLKDTNLTYRYDGSAWLSDAGTTSPLTTKGDVWGYSTADARIPVGADGTVLTADSGETLGVKWAAAAGGAGMTLLASGSHSGTTLTLSSISTSYINLFLILDGIDVSTTSYLLLRFNNDTTSSRHRAWDATADGGTFTQTNGIISAEMNATGSTNSALISVPNYANTNSWKFATSDSFVINNASTSNWSWRNSKVGYNQTAAITQLDIFESASGSFSCSYKLYGVK